jgi:hypothetical protein
MKLCIDGKSIEATNIDETKMSCRDLEDMIETFATGKKEDSNALNISICSRRDCYLLDCRRPLVLVQSTLGVIEEAIEEGCDIDSVNPILEITTFHGSSVSSDMLSCPIPPHSEWTRTSSRIEKKSYHYLRNKLLWLDLTEPTMELNDVADCSHFLRSLLGSSHHASPWGDDSDGEEYSVVALLVRGSLEILERFRTTDVCPSYFLHSISRLQIPPNDPLWWKRTSTVEILNQSTCDVSLLVYKKLPPRDSYTLINTVDSKHLVEGCMWESFCRQAEIDDDDDGKVRMQEYWRQVAPPYINHKQDYPTLLEPLLQHLETIRNEALSIPQWTAWPEKNHYSSHPTNPDAPTWTVFPLCHCFPANSVENKKWIHATCTFVPKTTSLLQTLLGDYLRTALFSRLDPETTLEAHTGWEDLANHVYRLHLPLVVPPGGLCGTWVDGVVETHETGRLLCFDDSKIHRAFNYSKKDRIVLILDMVRPSDLPLGTAIGGHTEELDGFINSLT